MYMSPYLVLLLSLKFFPSRFFSLPYGLESNVTKLLANLLTNPSVFYYLPIVSCNLVSIKIIIIIIILLHIHMRSKNPYIACIFFPIVVYICSPSLFWVTKK